MPQPTISDVHLDRILTNFSVARLQDPNNFVAGKVFPIVPVTNQSNKYYIYDTGDFARDEMTIRAPGQESAGSGYNLSRDNYYADIWALHKDVDDPTRANYDNPLDPDADAVIWLNRMALINQERRWAAGFFAPSVWANESDPGDWTDPGATPVQDVLDAKEVVVLDSAGFEPNIGVISYPVYLTLRNHPDIIDRYKYTTNQVITAEMIAKLMDLDQLLVARSVYNAAAQGAADDFNFILGNHMLLTYVPPNPGLRTPMSGATFMWSGVSGGFGETVGVKKFRMEWLQSDRIEIQIAYSQKMVGNTLGYLLKDVLS